MNLFVGGCQRVDEQEVAVVSMFGKVIRTDTAGLYFKIPWVQSVQKVDTTTHGTSIGYVIDGDGQEFTVGTESVMITSDFNLIDIDFYMEYNYIRSLDALKASLTGGNKTIILDKDSELAKILYGNFNE